MIPDVKELLEWVNRRELTCRPPADHVPTPVGDVNVNVNRECDLRFPLSAFQTWGDVNVNRES